MKIRYQIKSWATFFLKGLKELSLGNEVYDQLKKMILTGKFKKGQRLVEEKLANRLNVSRNPIQIALLRLRKEKLCVWKYKKGTFVTWSTWKIKGTLPFSEGSKGPDFPHPYSPSLFPLSQNGGEGRVRGVVEENTAFHYFCEAQY